MKTPKKPRNRYQINENGTAALTIRRLDGTEHVVIFDAADLDTIQRYQWRLHPADKEGRYFYAVTRSGDRRVQTMGRVLLGLTDSGRDIEVRHHNGQGLDCRRSNLAASNRSEIAIDSQQLRPPAGSGGAYCVCRIGDRYRVDIKRQTRNNYVGTYSTVAEAIIARDAWLAGRESAA